MKCPLSHPPGIPRGILFIENHPTNRTEFEIHQELEREAEREAERAAERAALQRERQQEAELEAESDGQRTPVSWVQQVLK